jgi:hypothetical protein
MGLQKPRHRDAEPALSGAKGQLSKPPGRYVPRDTGDN